MFRLRTPSRYVGLAACSCLAFALRPGSAGAQSVWTGTSTSGTSLWSSSANWLGGSVPASGATTSLQYFNNTTTTLPSGTITANNDNAGTFTLNRLVLRGLSPATTATTSVVINGGDLAFGGSSPALTLEGQSTTGVLNYTVANNIAFNANTTLGGDGTAGLTLSGVLSGNGTLTKTGASTVQFSGNSSSTFSGGVVIRGGALQVNGGVGGRLPASQAIAFAGGGTFTYSGNNVGASGTVGAVEFQSGLGLVQTNRGSAGNNFLTVSSFSVGQGATGRFAIGAGSNGSTTGVRIANQAVGFMGANVNFGGSGFAFYLSGSGTAGYVGNATYGTTANTAALTGNLVSLGTNANVHIQYTPTQTGTAVASTGTSGGSMVTVTTPGAFSVGSVVAGSGVPTFTYVTAISGSTLTLSKSLTGANPSLASFSAVSTQPTATIASLALAAGNGGTVLLDTGATLTISSGGISRPGNNSTAGSVIAGGAGITTGGTNPIVYYADGVNGGVSIQTPILATTTGGLIVAAQSSAPLQLAAANAFTGGVWFNGGVAEVAATETPGTSGPLGASGLIRFYGGQLRYSAANTFDYSSRFSTEAGQSFSVSTNSQNVTWATSLTSVGASLTKANSAGNLTLSASNAFTSATVSGGLVRIGDANALGSGTVTLSGGGLATADATDRTIMNPIRITADPTLGVTGAGRLTLAGAVEIVPSAITVTVPGGITTELSGPISGTNTAFTLANSANANLILSGNNANWTPASFSINNNGITVGHPNALGSGSATFTALNNASLVVNADLTGVNARANSLVLGGALTISGSQGLTLTNSVTGSGADRTLTNNIQSDKLLTLAGPVVLRIATDTAARVITFSGSGNTTISGTVANGGASGSASILKSGTGILRLMAANTYTGTTGISAGTLAIAGTDSLPGWNTAGRYGVAASASLAVQSGVADASVPTILGTGNFAANAGFGFDTSDGNRTYADAAIGNTGAGTLNFVKIGSGTLTMNAANTYSGTTRILEGAMRIGVANAIPAASPVVLTGNGSLDVANATSSGTVTVSGSGSIFGTSTLTGLAYVFNGVAGTASVSAILGGTAANLTKSNAGTVMLSGLSTYGGKTTVSGGVLEFTSIANSGTANSSALGAPTSANATIDLASGATLRYTGTGGHSTDRAISLSSTTGTATIEAAGSGPITLGAVTAAASGTVTLELRGASTAGDTLAGVIANPSGGITSLLKSGTGSWTLSGNNLHSGQTSITEGTLIAASNSVFGVSPPATLVGGTDAGLGGSAALLLAGTTTLNQTLQVTAVGGGATQTVILGGANTSGTTSFGSAIVRVGRDVTLQAAAGGAVRFRSNWTGASGSGSLTDRSFTFGSVGNTGTVIVSSSIVTTSGSMTVVAGVLRLADQIVRPGAGQQFLVGSAGELAGTGTVAAVLAGSGGVGPGNSPGILLADGVDPTGGLDFDFEFTDLAPVYSSPTASVNDILRLTGTAPFTQNLTALNSIDIYFPAAVLTTATSPAQTYRGGFFTDSTAAQYAGFKSAISGASFTYYVSDPSGTISYKGNPYSLLPGTILVTPTTTTVASAGFSGGTVTNGQIMTFVVVPEPGALALAAIGIAAAAHALRRRGRLP